MWLSQWKQICGTESAKNHNDPNVQEYSDHEFVKETESVQIGSLLDSHYSIDSDLASGSIWMPDGPCGRLSKVLIIFFTCMYVKSGKLFFTLDV